MDATVYSGDFTKARYLQEAIEGVTKPPKATDEGPKDDIETTEEEIEGYHIVRAIVSGVVDPERVVHRDTRS